MSSDSTASTVAEDGLLAAARDGDESAFAQLVERYRGELQAHCYRMLGSLHDAEDALQEAMLRAWRGLPRFEGRSSLRSWLYRIATNTCLDAIARRPKRVLPVARGPAGDPGDGPGEPEVESVWIEPYPDEVLAVEDGYAAPEARYERRESIELAFIVALQHLPPNQRAVLILREVLGYSAREVAETLDTSTASVNSALQRARKAAEERLPDHSQQQALRALGDDGVREVVSSYVDAWDRGDIDGVVALLTEDASFSMPPMSRWFRGRGDIAAFLRFSPLSGRFRWKMVAAQANGQPAIAFYTWDEGEVAYMPFALNVLSFEGDRIAAVTAFIVRPSQDPAPEVQQSLPDLPFEARRLEAAYDAFGLPTRLD